MHQNAPFQKAIIKNFLGRGHSPLPRPHPWWGAGVERGHPLPTPHPHRGLRPLDTRAFGARLAPKLAPSALNPPTGLNDKYDPGYAYSVHLVTMV